MDHTHHACSGKGLYLVDGERLQPFLNEGAGTALCETKFGMGMKIPAPSNHLIMQLLNFVDHRHLHSSYISMSSMYTPVRPDETAKG